MTTDEDGRIDLLGSFIRAQRQMANLSLRQKRALLTAYRSYIESNATEG